MMARSPLVLLLLALIPAACATTPAPMVPPGELPGIEGRECEYLSSREAVAGWRGGAPDAPWWMAEGAAVAGPVTLSVRYGPDGGLEWVRPIGPATAAAERLAEAVASDVEPESEPLSGVRLRFAPGRAAEVLPAVVCNAALSAEVPFLRGASGRVDFRQLPPNTNRLRYVVEVRVAPDGRPVKAAVTRRSPPFPSLEATLVESGMHQRYLPALHDGFPVAGTYTHEHEMRLRRSLR